MAPRWEQLLRDGTNDLERVGLEDAERKLRWWIAEQLDCGLFSIPLSMEAEETLSRQFASVLDRLAGFEPIQYICGSAPFRDFEVEVSSDVLIPRPETEQLVDLALREVLNAGDRVADIGTGSGCIAIAVKRALPSCRVTAVDISPGALRIAARNAENLGADIFFHPSNLCASLQDKALDVLIANLPYVSDAEMQQLPKDVRRFEPALALIGGQDGTDLIRALLADADRVLDKDGRILLETGESHGHEVQQIAEQSGWSWDQRTDSAGRPRFWILHRST